MNHFTQLLGLPAAARVDLSFPKAFFERNFDPTTSERKLLHTPYLPLRATWLASLKPTTANVSAYRDATSAYEEIQYFALYLSTEHFDTKANALAALYHRYLPYQLLLFLHSDTHYRVSAATISLNRADADRRVVEMTYDSPVLSLLHPDEAQQSFEQSLHLARLPTADLRTTYEGYLRCLAALRRSERTGRYRPAGDALHTKTRLAEIERLERDIRSLTRRLRSAKSLRDRQALQDELNAKRTLLTTTEKQL